jgi:hypothetical protein
MSCEVSWFAALCDDDCEFLGQAEPALQSSWQHCRDIALMAQSAGFDNLLLPSGYTLGIDSVAFAAVSCDLPGETLESAPRYRRTQRPVGARPRGGGAGGRRVPDVARHDGRRGSTESSTQTNIMYFISFLPGSTGSSSIVGARVGPRAGPLFALSITTTDEFAQMDTVRRGRHGQAAGATAQPPAALSVARGASWAAPRRRRPRPA